jgi:hypothetical protein
MTREIEKQTTLGALSGEFFILAATKGRQGTES